MTKRYQQKANTPDSLARANDDFIAWQVTRYTRTIHAMLEATRGLPKQAILIHRLNKVFTALAEDFDQGTNRPKSRKKK